MKKFIYILFAAAFLGTSCYKEQTATDDGKLPIFRGYMQFSTHVSNSRAHLAEDMRGKDFGVIGFKYSPTSNWETSKSTASPGDWFYNVDVACNADNGVCSYSPVKQWENYNYSFFAYHPYGGTGISLSANSVSNTPMLTYTYGWLNQQENISVYDSDSPIFDLMTAEAIDVNGSGSGTVSLDFNHRLFAFEVLVNNYNETTYEYEVDGNGNFILDDKGNKKFKLDDNGKKIVDVSAAQKITNLTLRLEGLKNTSMTIPLSMLNDEENGKIAYTAGDVGTRTFSLSSGVGLTIPAFNETLDRTFNGVTETCGAGVATSISKYGHPNGGYLFLIPQEGTNTGVTGTVSWDELGGFDSEDITNTFNSTIDFEPGVLYQIHINFVGSGITIALIEAGTWDTHPDVEHNFE